ncbi:hypothetical protein DFP72DRAFT_811985 [Ephemerocybe angulata]|uniref:Fungal-type protein kinase domain-containing protein n=1 Tax=Ephemerocybe angulata TaxID=980116 RepID=A0A8H6M575_9AGAR|nr:hypothetical protein DFP72DRAFT_811985 [Tulosesus angulatus]
MAYISREIFLAQPNRLFVRVLVLTPFEVRIIQYDRAGALYSRFFDYRRDPDILIRLVVGLASAREQDIGLDTSILWGTRNGRKIPGIIMTKDANTGGWRLYRMHSVAPFMNYSGICDRGTRMWHVSDWEGRALVLKDAWSTVHMGPPEYVYLKQARGVMGVQQLVDYEDRTGLSNGEIRFIRPRPTADYLGAFTNKSFQRVVTLLYGAPIRCFTDETMLLEAMHDAVWGHWELLKKGVLHCDISTGNILFGQPGTTPGLGFRGILIDLDYAVEYDHAAGPFMSRRAVGTAFYQSIILLRGVFARYKPAHDYIDDLESFYYILVDLIFGRFRKTDIGDCMNQWGSDDPAWSASAKEWFLRRPLKEADIPNSWSWGCKKMMVALHKFVGDLVMAKKAIVGNMEAQWSLNAMAALHEKSLEHYCKFSRKIFEVIRTY